VFWLSGSQLVVLDETRQPPGFECQRLGSGKGSRAYSLRGQAF